MAYQPNRIQVPRTARYFTIGDREGADEVWLVLHGYSLADKGPAITIDQH